MGMRCENDGCRISARRHAPRGAQTNAEEWARFFELFGHAKIRRGIRLMSKLPSAPRCEACGNPFAGVGGWLMRRMDKSPSRKNPRWCKVCFEAAPQGGMTLTIGVLFADVRNSTALADDPDVRRADVQADPHLEPWALG